jgi:hypothetical protein
MIWCTELGLTEALFILYNECIMHVVMSWLTNFRTYEPVKLTPIILTVRIFGIRHVVNALVAQLLTIRGKISINFLILNINDLNVKYCVI